MPFQVKYHIPASMEEMAPHLGEGVSRPSPTAKTRLYALLVKQEGMPPMKVSMRAESPKKAKLYAGNCWPHSQILVVKCH